MTSTFNPGDLDVIEARQQATSAGGDHAIIGTSGTVRTNGQELYYEIHGDGPPLVLVMGIGYDSSLWTLQQVPALSTRFRVVLLDNRDAGRSSRAEHRVRHRGHGRRRGRSARRARYPPHQSAGLVDGKHDRDGVRAACGPSGPAGARRSGRGAARSAVRPISIWNWVKTADPSGEVFGAQQFTWLFSSAFLRNQQAVQETVALLASNPHPVETEAYDRQAQAYLHFDALDRLDGIKAPTLVIVGEQDLLTPPWVRAR